MATESMVEVNQSVKKDDELMSVSTDRISAAIGGTSSTVVDSLREQLASIDAQIELQKALLTSRTQQSTGLVDKLRMSQLKLSEQISHQNERVSSAEEVLTEVDQLTSKGYVSRLQINQLNSELSAARSQLANLEKAKADLDLQIYSELQKREQLPLVSKETMLNLRERREDVKIQISRAEFDRQAIIRSPVGGMITSVLVRDGQAVESGEELLAIAPDDKEIRILLFVPSASARFVVPGAELSLKLGSYPFRQFGMVSGQIISVSESSIAPSQVLSRFGQAVSERVFLAEARLLLSEAELIQKGLDLKLGMSVEAVLKLERKSLIRWIVGPSTTSG
ncbi:MAG: HlyD family efflux transporter periplasmic adaptor subunit [Pseudomonadota bacterium]